MEAGSINNPFKLAIVGGGPSGCAVFVRALRIGVLGDLCGSSAGGDGDECAGVCLIDQDSKERFGGGRFQDYIINSNTYAGKFVSNVMGEKLDLDPPERTADTPLAALSNSKWKKEVEERGNSHVNLSVVGGFLRDVGSLVVDAFDDYSVSSKLMTSTRVVSLQRVKHTPISRPSVKSVEKPLSAVAANVGGDADAVDSPPLLPVGQQGGQERSDNRLLQLVPSSTSTCNYSSPRERSL